VRLVADADVLRSAATGGRAALILARPDLAEIVTTASTIAEVQECAERLARKVESTEDSGGWCILMS
jgi:2-oxo-4-hydroxy-4-carboxy--5-ureidoimidazoline (OHCU) decarboxylase